MTVATFAGTGLHTELLAAVARQTSAWGHRTLCVDWAGHGSPLIGHLVVPSAAGRLRPSLTDAIMRGGEINVDAYVADLPLVGGSRLGLVRVDPRPDWPTYAGEVLQRCVDHWRQRYDVIVMHAGPHDRRFVLAQLPDVLVLPVEDHGELAELAALVEGAAVTRDGQPYDAGMLLALPVPVAPADPAEVAVAFAGFIRHWLDRTVPAETALAAVAVSPQKIVPGGPTARIAALIVRDFAGTKDLGRDPDSYVDAAAGLAGNPTLADLLARAGVGDQQAWREIVDRYSKLVWSVVRVHRLDHADAADVWQTTWLRLVENPHTLREPSRLPGWLAATAHRESLRLIAAGRRREAPQALPEGSDLDAAAGPEVLALTQERDDKLWQAFAGLGYRCQQLLRLLATEPKLPYSEISAILSIPVEAIGPTRARCLGRLRRRLSAFGIVVSDSSPIRHDDTSR